LKYAFQFFNICPHKEIKRTFRHGYVTDDIITPSLQKISISGQELFSHNAAPVQTSKLTKLFDMQIFQLQRMLGSFLLQL